VTEKLLGVPKVKYRSLKSVAGGLLRSRKTCNFYRILCFGQLQRSLGIDSDRLVLRTIGDVLAPLEQMIAGVDLFNGA